MLFPKDNRSCLRRVAGTCWCWCTPR